jgi:hypothetical protein
MFLLIVGGNPSFFFLDHNNKTKDKQVPYIDSISLNIIFYFILIKNYFSII